MEDFGNEIIEITETPTPTPEVEEIEALTIDSYDIGTYSAIGMGAAGACVIFGLGVGVIIRLFKRLY